MGDRRPIGECTLVKDAQGFVVCGDFPAPQYSVDSLGANELCADIAAAPSDEFTVAKDGKDPKKYKVTHKNISTEEETDCYIKQDSEDEYTAWSMLATKYITSKNRLVAPDERPSCASHHIIDPTGKHVWKVDNKNNIISRKAKSTLPPGFTSTGNEVTSNSDILPVNGVPVESADSQGNSYTDFGEVKAKIDCPNATVSLFTKPYLIRSAKDNSEIEKLISVMRSHFGLGIPVSSLSSSNSTASKVSADCARTNLGSICGLSGGGNHNPVSCKSTCETPYCCRN
jgi:hypothetical protein